MQGRGTYISLSAYFLVIALLFVITFGGSRAITVVSQQPASAERTCFVIDAGHGGVDGGATSCTGVVESQFNLEIATRLNDLMHLLGMKTKMIRTTDVSVYTSGETIAAKKVSDLKERVRIVNSTENAVLISIHQNYFSQSQYSGAQVFYGSNDFGRQLAQGMQSEFKATVNKGGHREAKKASGIYLLEHVQCPAILIECGFLSNPVEEELLRSAQYQKKICCVISGISSQYALVNGTSS